MSTFNADETDHLPVFECRPGCVNTSNQSKVVGVLFGHLLDHVELFQRIPHGNVGGSVLKGVSHVSVKATATKNDFKPLWGNTLWVILPRPDTRKVRSATKTMVYKGQTAYAVTVSGL